MLSLFATLHWQFAFLSCLVDDGKTLSVLSRLWTLLSSCWTGTSHSHHYGSLPSSSIGPVSLIHPRPSSPQASTLPVLLDPLFSLIPRTCCHHTSTLRLRTISTPSVRRFTDFEFRTHSIPFPADIIQISEFAGQRALHTFAKMPHEDKSMGAVLAAQDPIVQSLVREEVDHGVLIPLKTTLELRDDHVTGRVLITRTPVKSANPTIRYVPCCSPPSLLPLRVTQADVYCKSLARYAT